MGLLGSNLWSCPPGGVRPDVAAGRSTLYRPKQNRSDRFSRRWINKSEIKRPPKGPNCAVSPPASAAVGEGESGRVGGVGPDAEANAAVLNSGLSEVFLHFLHILLEADRRRSSGGGGKNGRNRRTDADNEHVGNGEGKRTRSNPTYLYHFRLQILGSLPSK